MKLAPYVTELNESLAAVAAVGDADLSRLATLMSAMVEPAARIAIFRALSDFADEATSVLGDTHISVRLTGHDVMMTTSRVHLVDVCDDVLPPFTSLVDPDEPAAMARITLRLPEGLKAEAELTAADAGVSLNTWLTRLVQFGVRPVSGAQR
jgi:hypothetical protein